MKVLKIVLLEAALELVPSSIASHPAVLSNARKRGKPPSEMLLDVSVHYHAMGDLPKKHKRGRPDIAHICLLEALESPLNKEGALRIAVHTLEGHAIFIDPSTRIPRNYNRFVGLMEQLFKQGQVPPGSGSPLISMRTMPLGDLIRAMGAGGLLLLREACPRKGPLEVVEEALGGDLAIGIGAFPHGDFDEDTVGAASSCYSIYSRELTAWSVLSRIIVAAEIYQGII